MSVFAPGNHQRCQNLVLILLAGVKFSLMYAVHLIKFNIYEKKEHLTVMLSCKKNKIFYGQTEKNVVSRLHDELTNEPELLSTLIPESTLDSWSSAPNSGPGANAINTQTYLNKDIAEDKQKQDFK